MVARDSRAVEYDTDQDETIFIRIQYEEGLGVTPSQRFDDGGFGDQDLTGCRNIIERTVLKPRYIEKNYGSNTSPNIQRVYVKDLDTYISLIDEDTTIRYVGEQGCRLNS